MYDHIQPPIYKQSFILKVFLIYASSIRLMFFGPNKSALVLCLSLIMNLPFFNKSFATVQFKEKFIFPNNIMHQKMYEKCFHHYNT